MRNKWILGIVLGLSFSVICGNAKEIKREGVSSLSDIVFVKAWKETGEDSKQEFISCLDFSMLEGVQRENKIELKLEVPFYKEEAEEEIDSETTIEENFIEEVEVEPEVDVEAYDFTVAFAGDINFADSWNTMEYYRQQGNDISKCIDPVLMEKMQAADLMCLNLEFCLSSKGSPLENKYYTFRADPAHTEILKELGVDLANLANNHAYDYGKEAFLEMLLILQREEIAYVGGGSNAEEAQKPYYFDIDGKKVAIVTASRAEKMILTPEAKESSPGIFRCYDTTRLLEVVKEAREEADFVIAYIHWGTEYSEVLEDAQINGAYDLIDAGVDVVLGAHPHCLQGMEFYKGKPILYSLGNYWFNEKSLDSILVELHFYGNEKEQYVEPILVPAKQENFYTRYLFNEEEVEAWKNHLIKISPAEIQIEENGILREVKNG